MSSSARIVGSCVECSPRYPTAGKSNQDTGLPMSLPALLPAEMGSLYVETVWFLKVYIDQHSKQACLAPFVARDSCRNEY